MKKPASPTGGQISQVSGIAAAAGLRPGDRLLAVDGHPLRDVIDFRFYADGPTAHLRYRRGGQERAMRLRRPAGTDWGLEFQEPLFDHLRRCNNRCLFCFLDQLPPGWRRTLYLRDDDYRLSFLYGNFVTLTNLREEDWARLREQRLSPLFVSVQATEPELRRFLLGRRHIPDILEQLQRLGRLRIAVHAQVVLCPGINDGPHLERTLEDLASLAETVRSVALVPVGLTRFRTIPPVGLEVAGSVLRPYTPEEARALLAWAAPRRRASRRNLGCTWLYPADELYLLAGRPVPRADHYDGFPQMENGVGLVRALLDDWARVRRRLKTPSPGAGGEGVRATLATGTLIAPVLQKMAGELAARMPGLEVEVRPIENATLGPNVTVAGLLTAADLRAGLRQARGDILFLPRVAFDAQGRALDDGTTAELESDLGRPIVLVETMGEVLAALRLKTA